MHGPVHEDSFFAVSNCAQCFASPYVHIKFMTHQQFFHVLKLEVSIVLVKVRFIQLCYMYKCTHWEALFFIPSLIALFQGENM